MVFWKKSDGWTFEYFDLNTNSDEFDNFAPMVDLWNSKREGALLPAWSLFDFYDFKGWHGKICKSTVMYNPYDFRIDLYGSVFRDLFGKEYTGSTSNELLASGDEDHYNMGFYQMVSEKALISRVTGTIPSDKSRPTKVKILELPLSNDGIDVSHTIEFIHEF